MPAPRSRRRTLSTGSSRHPACPTRGSWRPARRGAARATAGAGLGGSAVGTASWGFWGGGGGGAPPAIIDDGVLDLVLMRDAPKLAFVRALLKIKDGSHIALPQISLDRAADVTITMSRDIPAGADGEPLSCATPLRAWTPLRIRALPAALTVLVPAS